MNDPMAAFRARFLDRCRAELPILRDPAHPDFRKTVHGLNGAAGTFGFPEISALAEPVDAALADGRAPDPADIGKLIASVEAAIRPA